MSSTSLTTRDTFKYVRHLRHELSDYQENLAVPFIKENPFCLLLIDLGLGKTISTLTALVDLIRAGEVENVLVIGPIRVIAVGWPDEIKKWQHTAWLSHTIIRVDDNDPRLKAAFKAARTKAIKGGSDYKEADSIARAARTAEKERLREALIRKPSWIHLINNEAIPWLIKKVGRKFPWDAVVIDESSMWKDHSTERVKAMLFARRTTNIKRMIELSANPTPEGYMGFFSQIGLLDDGKRLGRAITPYREEYFIQNAYTRSWKLRDGSEDKILDRIADLTLVMQSKDYLPMTEPKVVKLVVKMTPEQMALYKQMERDRVITLANDTEEGVEIEAKSAADLSNKLLQMASGMLYEEVMVENPKTGLLVPSKVTHDIHDHKLAELQRLVEALDGDPILVTYHYKASLDRIMKALPKAQILDKEGKLITKWNKGQVPVMVANAKSASHGLNLQYGGCHMCIYDVIWSLDTYTQLIGRLQRQGQTRLVTVFKLITHGTLDHFADKRISEKRDASDDMFRRLKRLIAAHRARALRAN